MEKFFFTPDSPHGKVLRGAIAFLLGTPENSAPLSKTRFMWQYFSFICDSHVLQTTEFVDMQVTMNCIRRSPVLVSKYEYFLRNLKIIT